MSGIAFGVGIGLWTLLEYVLHRFVFHQFVFGRAPAREHLEHHAKVDWFAPWSSKLTLAALVLAVLTTLLAPLVGAGPAASLVSGVVGGWLAYEALHRAIHVVPPRGAYARWAWRHHLHHHFRNPSANHGVSSPLWDVVFGTFEPVEQVVVPARQAGKLPWLLDEQGAVRPELSGVFSVRTR